MNAPAAQPQTFYDSTGKAVDLAKRPSRVRLRDRLYTNHPAQTLLYNEARIPLLPTRMFGLLPFVSVHTLSNDPAAAQKAAYQCYADKYYSEYGTRNIRGLMADLQFQTITLPRLEEFYVALTDAMAYATAEADSLWHDFKKLYDDESNIEPLKPLTQKLGSRLMRDIQSGDFAPPVDVFSTIAEQMRPSDTSGFNQFKWEGHYAALANNAKLPPLYRAYALRQFGLYRPASPWLTIKEETAEALLNVEDEQAQAIARSIFQKQLANLIDAQKEAERKRQEGLTLMHEGRRESRVLGAKIKERQAKLATAARQPS